LARQFARSRKNAGNLQINGHSHTNKLPLQFIRTIHAVKYLIAEVISFSLHFTSTGVQRLSHGLPTHAPLFPVLERLSHTSGEASYKYISGMVSSFVHIFLEAMFAVYSQIYRVFWPSWEHSAEKVWRYFTHTKCSLAGCRQVCMTLHTRLSKAVRRKTLESSSERLSRVLLSLVTQLSEPEG
jgi:hypothetical protein